MGLRVTGERGALPECQLAWETVKKQAHLLPSSCIFIMYFPGLKATKGQGRISYLLTNFLFTNQLPNQVTDELKKPIGLFTEQKVNQPNTRRSN